MKILFTGYINVQEFNDPHKWLRRIKGYLGILEALTKYHTIISIEQINYEGNLIENAVEYCFVNSKKKRNYLPFKLHKFIRKKSPDLVIIHSFDFPLQVLLLKFQLSNNTKIVIQNHAEKPASGLKKYLQQHADKFITGYMFTSVVMGEEWAHQNIIRDPKKIWGIMEASSFFNPMEKNIARQKTNVKNGTIYLFVGRLDENKDPITVVDAFIKFKQQNTDAYLYMVYHTTELLEKIKISIANRGVNDSIGLIGQVPHDEMIYWYNSADFIISGSHYEGSGVAVCEAMSCGCIPVLTNILSFKKLTGNGFCGILYTPGSVEDLFQALLKTTTIKKEEERKKVLEQFRNDLSFEAIADQINSKITSI